MDADINDLRRLFQDTLGIRNISHEHIIAELQHLAANEQPEGADILEKVRNLYHLLQNMHETDPNIASQIRYVDSLPTIHSSNPSFLTTLLYRSAFAASPLIYTPSSPSWHLPTNCLWSTTSPIPSKTPIDTIYPTLAHLFTTVLNVPVITLSMVCTSLRDIAGKSPTPEIIKPLLETLNSLLPASPDSPNAGPLVQLPIFPVVNWDGTRELVSSTTKFFIPDREDLIAAFGGRVRCLDFSLAEACRMRPFLEWAGVQGRGMAKLAKEMSRVDGEVRPVRDKRREVGRKGYALLRYVAPRTRLMCGLGRGNDAD